MQHRYVFRAIHPETRKEDYVMIMADSLHMAEEAAIDNYRNHPEYNATPEVELLKSSEPPEEYIEDTRGNPYMPISQPPKKEVEEKVSYTDGGTRLSAL